MKKPSLALDTSIVQDNAPQQVIPGVFIGSIHAAFNQEALLANGITHILNASRVPATFPRQFSYLSVDIRDREDANILSCIPASNIFIEAGIDGGGVLVHCFGGRSRSAGFVAAYLMSSRGWTLDHALEVIIGARPVACINKGFDRQLRAYMQTQYDVYLAQQVLLKNRIRSLHQLRGNVQELANTQAGALKEKFDVSNMKSPEVSEEENSSGQKRWREMKPSKNEEGGYDGNMEVDYEEESPREESLLKNPLIHVSQDKRVSEQLNQVRPEYISAAGGDGKQPKIPVAGEGYAPNCRLSRPGSSTVRVIPPLRGLERRYGCSSCDRSLFSLANVVLEDNALGPISNMISNSNTNDVSDYAARSSFGSSSSGSPKNQQHIRWAASKDDGNDEGDDEGMQNSGGIPAPLQSTRHANRKGFAFGDFDDSKDDFGVAKCHSPGESSSNESAMSIADTPQANSNAHENKIEPPDLRSLKLPLGKLTVGNNARPQSAERRRWLARVSLLRADPKENIAKHPAVPDEKSVKLAADDQGVVDKHDKGEGQFFCIEYMGWMGMDPLTASVDEGKIECPGCTKPIGSWSWNPDPDGKLEPPLFMAMRSSVKLADMPLDSTPMSTPRQPGSNSTTPRLEQECGGVMDSSPNSGRK